MKWLKQIFGIKEDSVNLDERFTNASATSELVISPRTNTESTDIKYTKANLNKLSKIQIDDLAKDVLGIELDRRKKKESMIKDFLSAQKEAK